MTWILIVYIVLSTVTISYLYYQLLEAVKGIESVSERLDTSNESINRNFLIISTQSKKIKKEADSLSSKMNNIDRDVKALKSKVRLISEE